MAGAGSRQRGGQSADTASDYGDVEWRGEDGHLASKSQLGRTSGAEAVRPGLRWSVHQSLVYGIYSESVSPVSMDRGETLPTAGQDRKSTRLNSSHVKISYAVFCLKKK